MLNSNETCAKISKLQTGMRQLFMNTGEKCPEDFQVSLGICIEGIA